MVDHAMADFGVTGHQPFGYGLGRARLALRLAQDDRFGRTDSEAAFRVAADVLLDGIPFLPFFAGAMNVRL